MKPSNILFVRMENEQLTIEQQLILKYSRIYSDFLGKSSAIDLLTEKLNWNYILEYSLKHGIAPLLYKFINNIGAKQYVPTTTYESLRNSYFQTFSKNTRLFEEFSHILKNFDLEGIHCILLKGIVLAEFMYNDIGLRPMDDIDILVKQEDLEKVQQILLDNGYQTADIVKSKFVGQFAKAHHLPPFVKGSHIIEVHWHIHHDETIYQIDIKDFWCCTIPAQLGKYKVLIPDDNNMLLHLCLHLEAHFSSETTRLLSFCDIAEFIKQKSINWDTFLTLSQKYNANEITSKFLYILQKYFEVPLSESTSVLIGKADILETRFLALIQNKSYLSSDINFNIQALGKVKGFGNKVRYLLGDLFPTKKFMIMKYRIKNKNLVYFYYPLRFGIGLSKLFTFIISFLFKKK